MYAIIADGGRQYKVEQGQILEIDYRAVEPGEQLTFDRVLAVSSDDGFKLGKPTVDGASVSAKVLGESKGEKIFVMAQRREDLPKRKRSFFRLSSGSWVTPKFCVFFTAECFE